MAVPCQEGWSRRPGRQVTLPAAGTVEVPAPASAVVSAALSALVTAGLAVAAGTVLAKLAIRGHVRRSHRSRTGLFAVLPTGQADVVMLGDSLTEAGEWQELLLPGLADTVRVVNRGISGDRTVDVRRRLDAVVGLRPRVVVLMVGINDLMTARPVDAVVEDHARIVSELLARIPGVVVVTQSVLPVRGGRSRRRLQSRVDLLNAGIRARSDASGRLWVDVAAVLGAPDGMLDRRLTEDGVHLLGEGYRRWAGALAPVLAGVLAR